MKGFIPSLVLAGLFVGLTAFGQDNNKFTTPLVPVAPGYKAPALKLPTQDFARQAHQDNLEACVNEVAVACDGHFTRDISRMLTGFDILAPGSLKAFMTARLGMSQCGHYASQTAKT